MITNQKTTLALSAVSIVFACFSMPCFANSHSQQIVSISQEIQSIQTKLTAANNKLEKICGCTITKNIPNQIDKIHQTANGRR